MVSSAILNSFQRSTATKQYTSRGNTIGAVGMKLQKWKADQPFHRSTRERKKKTIDNETSGGSSHHEISIAALIVE